MFPPQWISSQIPTLALPILIVTLPQLPSYAQVVPDQTLANPSQLTNQENQIQTGHFRLEDTSRILFLAAIAAGRLEPDGETIDGIFSVTTAGQSSDVTFITLGDVRTENGSIVFMPVLRTGPARDITITTRHLINDRGGLITSNTGGTIATELA